MVDADESAIRRLLGTYCQRCDDGDFDELAQLFAPDAELELRGDVITGRDAIGKWFEAAQPPERRGKHLTVNALIDVDGDSAVSNADFLFLRHDEGVLASNSTGRYEDELVRLDGRWLFGRRRIQILGPTG